MTAPEVELTVYPDECDAYGHLNQASFLALFERARWETLRRGPGMDLFERHGAWPAVRHAEVDYVNAAYPGEVLRFRIEWRGVGRTSFVLRQLAHDAATGRLVAEAVLTFVCIDRDGRPMRVPGALAEELGSAWAVPPMPTRHVEHEGAVLAVADEGDGPAIVFLHGYPLDRTLWTPLAAALPGWRRVALDLRGMGDSTTGDADGTMAQYARDVRAVLDALRIERAVLCGLSMGGYVAFECARQWPARLRALVLMATRADADSADTRAQRDAAAALAREQGAGPIADRMLPRLLAPRTLERDPALAAALRDRMTATPAAGIENALRAMRDRPDSAPLLPSLGAIPVLVVAGSDDQLTPPPVVQAIAHGIPGAEFVLVPDAGHLPPLEQPGPTARAVAAFLARRLPRRG